MSATSKSDLSDLKNRLIELNTNISNLDKQRNELNLEITRLEETLRLDESANLSDEEEIALRKALSVIAKCICGSHAIIGYLNLDEGDPETNDLSTKYSINISKMSLIKDMGNIGLLFKVRIVTKSLHVKKIVRETFLQEGHIDDFDHSDDTTRNCWTVNWDFYQAISFAGECD